MKERPIIFGADSVRAILAGTKTQTRRVLAPGHHTLALDVVALCPYGAVGDVLWLREAWRARLDQDHLAPRELPWNEPWYCATGSGHGDEQPSGCAGGVGKKRSPRHMPRWASRITLEITDVRVQRLQEISNDDAKAEGVTTRCEEQSGEYHGDMTDHLTHNLGCHTEAFERAWDAINGKRAPWSSNPWVWAITFKVAS